MLNIRIMPVTQWPGKETKNPKGSTFRSGYKDTLKLLEYELSKCGKAELAHLEMWVDARMIRQDGSCGRMQGSTSRALSFRFTRETNVGRIRQNPENESAHCSRSRIPAMRLTIGRTT
jgi:hypothetical protein